MVQSRKKKKKGPSDFKSAKSKVGKQAVKADNFTNTSFKSQTIVIRGQKTLENGEGAKETNHRNLTLTDLLGQVKHYNLNVRKDACYGLKEIFALHPRQLHLHLNLILERIVPLKTDPESSVRKALIGLLQYILASTSRVQIEPFIKLLIAHTSSAMTHIRDDIRRDSMHFIDFYLDAFPEMLVEHSGVLISNFVNIISSGVSGKQNGSTARALIVKPNSKVSSSEARALVLSRLDALLKQILAVSVSKKEGSSVSVNNEGNKTCLDWKLTDLYASTLVVDGGKPSTKADFGFPSVWGKSLERELSRQGVGNLQGLSKTSGFDFGTFMQNILPILKECMIEASPRALSGSDSHALTMNLSSTVVVIQNLLTVCRLSTLVEERAGVEGVNKCLQSFFPDFCRYFLSHFPLGSGVDLSNGTVYEQVSGLNFALCEISLFFPQFLGNSPAVRSYRALVLDFLLTFLRNGDKRRNANDEMKTRSVRFEQALEVVKKLFKYCDLPTAASFVEALFDCFLKFNCKSLLKRAICFFFMNFIDDDLPRLFSCYRTDSDAEKEAKRRVLKCLCKWASSLMPYLWEIDDSDFALTSEIISLLRNLLIVEGGYLQFEDISFHKQINEHCSVALSPLFHSSIEDRESESGTKKDVYGPFVRYPEGLQQKLLSVLHFLNEMPRNLIQSVTVASHHFGVSTKAVEDFSYLVSRHVENRFDYSPTIKDLSGVLSSDISIILGYSQKDILESSVHQEEALAVNCLLGKRQLIQESPDFPCGKSMYPSLREVYERRGRLADALGGKYANLYFGRPVVGVLVDKLISFCENKDLPMDSYYSTCKFLANGLKLRAFAHFSSEEVERIVNFVCKYCLYLYYHLSNLPSDIGKMTFESSEVCKEKITCLLAELISIQPNAIIHLLEVAESAISMLVDSDEASGNNNDIILSFVSHCVANSTYDGVFIKDSWQPISIALDAIRANGPRARISPIVLETFFSNN
eukprot:Nk52_evm56s1073 gene=Nk52_evmTU56s1073